MDIYKIPQEAWEAALSDAVLAPLAMGEAEWMRPEDILTHEALQFRAGADPLTGVAHKLDDDDKGIYDVDKGGCLLVWRRLAGSTYVADGHHRLDRAKTAKHFVSSRLHKGNHVPVERKLPVRVLREVDGWTPQLVKKQGAKLNEGTVRVATNPKTTTPEEADLLMRDEHECTCGGTCDHCHAEAQSDSIEVEEIEEVEEANGDAYEVARGDASKGILCRIRQFGTEVNKRNGNRRVYPDDVFEEGRTDGLPYARSGVMVSEMLHPKSVKICQGKVFSEEFINNLDRTTATVDDIEAAQADGKVYIWRSIRNTPMGRIVWERVKRKDPVPISMRFKMIRDHARSDANTEVAKRIRIKTWDDVLRPAVHGAGEYEVMGDDLDNLPLAYTDEELEVEIACVDAYYATTENYIEPKATEETLEEGLGDPTQLVSNNTSNPEIKRKEPDLDSRGKGSASTDSRLGGDRPKGVEESKNMNEILRLQRRFISERAAKAPVSTLDATNAEWAKAITDAWSSAEGDVRPFVQTYQQVMTDSESSGYMGSKTAPYIQMGNEIGEDPMGGWGKDTKSGISGTGEGELTNMNAKVEPGMVHAYTKSDQLLTAEESPTATGFAISASKRRRKRMLAKGCKPLPTPSTWSSPGSTRTTSSRLTCKKPFGTTSSLKRRTQRKSSRLSIPKWFSSAPSRATRCSRRGAWPAMRTATRSTMPEIQ